MNFYLVGVGSVKYHGHEPLTYHSPKILTPGSVVSVLLRGNLTIGLVLKLTKKPNFKTKPIEIILNNAKPLPPESLELLDWLMHYYPAPLGAIVQQFLPSSLSLKNEKNIDEAVKIEPFNTKNQEPKLTQEQKSVVSTIHKSPAKTFLLHGETGSGKTRVYTDLARQTLASERSVIILTPEISLTPQLVRSFQKIFGSQVILTHSGLTATERRRVWQTILVSNKPLVVIGPRSALFSPFKKIGLIVVDEFHEPAYKQEQQPKYQTLRVASALARIHKATLLFGSATPPVSDYYLAETKRVPILRMKEKAIVTTGKSSLDIRLVNLADSQELSSQPSLSKTLIKAIQATLDKKEQAMIFINRRGSARLVFCKLCGWQALCPRCNLSLTYHADRHLLRCHLCGYQEKARINCPSCGSNDIVFKSIGTKAIAVALQKLFPYNHIQRFDSDNTKKEHISSHYSEIKSGEVEILVGTQIIAKGLDLPRLSLVGMITAESSLQFPDYTASERTYQLITQLIGRVGRGHRPGTAIIQTYDPSNTVLNYALKQDWKNFYDNQLAERKAFGFPPFFHIVKLEIKRATSASARQACLKLIEIAKAGSLRIEIIGPSPCFIEKQKDSYHWQIIIKAKKRDELIKVIQLLPNGWSYDLDPSHLL